MVNQILFLYTSQLPPSPYTHIICEAEKSSFPNLLSHSILFMTFTFVSMRWLLSLPLVSKRPQPATLQTEPASISPSSAGMDIHLILLFRCTFFSNCKPKTAASLLKIMNEKLFWMKSSLKSTKISAVCYLQKHDVIMKGFAGVFWMLMVWIHFESDWILVLFS